jgi:hypothetical protein
VRTTGVAGVLQIGVVPPTEVTDVACRSRRRARTRRIAEEQYDWRVLAERLEAFLYESGTTDG